MNKLESDIRCLKEENDELHDQIAKYKSINVETAILMLLEVAEKHDNERLIHDAIHRIIGQCNKNTITHLFDGKSDLYISTIKDICKPRMYEDTFEYIFDGEKD